MLVHQRVDPIYSVLNKGDHEDQTSDLDGNVHKTYRGYGTAWVMMICKHKTIIYSGWWFQTFFIVHNI